MTETGHKELVEGNEQSKLDSARRAMAALDEIIADQFTNY